MHVKLLKSELGLWIVQYQFPGFHTVYIVSATPGGNCTTFATPYRSIIISKLTKIIEKN